MMHIFRNPLTIVSVALFVGGLVWNLLTSVSSTDVTIRVVLSPSGEVITDLAQIQAYETYFPEAGESIERYPQFGPIFPVDDRPNVFDVGRGVQAGFEATVGGAHLGPIGTTGGGVEEYTLTLSTRDGLVRLTVDTDGASEVIVQATSDDAPLRFEGNSQPVPEDRQMLFLLPEGEWTFAALGGDLDQTTVVSVPLGDFVEATLDLRSGS